MFSKILDLLFPPSCAKCQHEGFLLCEECRLSLGKKLICWCPICGKSVERDHNLEQHDLAFTQAWSLVSYHEPWMERTIQDMKFGGMYSYARVLGTVLGERLDFLFPQGTKQAVLVPLPLHKKRERERGFNQAMELAKGIAQTSNIPILNLLERAKKTQAQAKLKEVDRWENTKGAFRLRRKMELESALLVDDVITTGATLHAAAQTLNESGVKNILALTLAYSVPEQKQRHQDA